MQIDHFNQANERQLQVFFYLKIPMFQKNATDVYCVTRLNIGDYESEMSE